jgi:hypothetical protein
MDQGFAYRRERANKGMRERQRMGRRELPERIKEMY